MHYKTINPYVNKFFNISTGEPLIDPQATARRGCSKWVEEKLRRQNDFFYRALSALQRLVFDDGKDSLRYHDSDAFTFSSDTPSTVDLPIVKKAD